MVEKSAVTLHPHLIFTYLMSLAPAFLSIDTTVASYSGTKFSRILDAHVVLTPFVQSKSLRAIGMPSNG
ncbi:hypothetical protein MCHI_002507 [Candidatus Magnetoovum chiemensis]|nr:hypothetical protein MCHI_002507 [Candidatus Magnetoovum chiemensis]